MSYAPKHVSKIFNSVDYPQLNRAQYNNMVGQAFSAFAAALPQDKDYVSLPDVSGGGINCIWLNVNGVRAARQIRAYDAETDAFIDRIDAEYLEAEAPVEVKEERQNGSQA